MYWLSQQAPPPHEGGPDAVAMPDLDWSAGEWRIDIGPNRTAYERQLSTLVKLCSG